MYNYHIPKEDISQYQFFPSNEILEAQELTVEENLFPYFKSLKIDKLYSQNYPVEFLVDIIFKNPSFDEIFQEVIDNDQVKTSNRLILPTVYGYYQQHFKNNFITFETELSSIQKENINVIRKKSDPISQNIIINSIHAFSLKENNIVLQLNSDNTVLDYNIHHIRHGLKYGFNFVSENEIEELKEYIINPTNLDNLFNLQLEDDNSSLIQKDESYINYQKYVNKNTLTLHDEDNQKALKIIQDCLIASKYEHAYVEGKDHNDFTINYNFTSNIANIAYYNLKSQSSHFQLTYKTFNNFLENTVIKKLVNVNQQKTLTQLENIISSSDNLNLVDNILLNNESLYEPKMLELTSFLHNLSTSLSHKEYNLNNIKKYAPDHIFQFLLHCIDNVNNQSRETLLNIPSEDLHFKNSSVLLIYIFPLLNKYTKIETLPLLDTVFKTILKNNDKIKNNQSIDKWRNEHFTDYYNFNYNLNFIYNSVPFETLSFEEAILKAPHILDKLSNKLQNNQSQTLDISLTSIPSFVSKTISYFDGHFNDNFFNKTLKVSFQMLYNILSITQETLDDSKARSLVDYITPNIDISLYEKSKTPILYKDFTKNVKLEIQNEFQSSFYSSPFFTLISDALDKDIDYFRNADLNILQSYWDSKPLFFTGASNLALEFGFKNPINLFSKDFKEIPIIFSKFPEYKEYVINKQIIGKLLEDNSPYLQHPEIQQFLRSYNGISILTDNDYQRPSLEIIFPHFNEDEKMQLSQFFINPEMFILEGLYKDIKWMKYLSDDALNDPEYTVEVINQTFNFYHRDDAITNVLKFLKELPESFLLNEDNFKIVSSSIRNKVSDNFYVYLKFCENFYNSSPHALKNSQNFIFELDSISKYIKEKDKDSKSHYELLRTLLISSNPLLKNQLIEHPNDIDDVLEKILSQVDKIVMNLEMQNNTFTSNNTPGRKSSVKKF